MTDSLAALRCRVQAGGSDRNEALRSFHDRWRGELLVIGKWFAVQAASRAPGTFERVVELSRHPDFTLTNPNRMFALLSTIGAYAKAYEFTAEKVLEVDAFNPMAASRVAKSLAAGKRLEPGRRTMLAAVLRRLEESDLCRNTRETIESARDPVAATGAAL